MPRAPELPAAVRQSVARQIGQRLLPAPGFRPLAKSALGESFPIVFLRQDRVKTGGPISQAVDHTGRWHHQIVAPGRARMFARSRTSDTAERLQVEEVVQAQLAGAISRTIRWIDEVGADRLAPDAEAALLIAPAFYVTAFWLQDHGSDRVVIIDRPEGLATTLSLETVYPADEFLRLLAQSAGPFGMPERG